MPGSKSVRTTAMAITVTSILDVLDAAYAQDWPDFRMVSSLEYHAMRLVVLCEQGTDDWGLVFDVVAGSWVDEDDPMAAGVQSKIYGPSVQPHQIHVVPKRPLGLRISPHERLDLELAGVRVEGPAGTLIFDRGLVDRYDLRPGRVCNLDRASESPADVLLLRAYLATQPGSLFGSIADAANVLGGRESDVLLSTDAFEHVVPAPEEDELLAAYAKRPSESETYRSLAEAIATRDPARFRPGTSNLDWRIWARYEDESSSRV